MCLLYHLITVDSSAPPSLLPVDLFNNHFQSPTPCELDCILLASPIPASSSATRSTSPVFLLTHVFLRHPMSHRPSTPPHRNHVCMKHWSHTATHAFTDENGALTTLPEMGSGGEEGKLKVLLGLLKKYAAIPSS